MRPFFLGFIKWLSVLIHEGIIAIKWILRKSAKKAKLRGLLQTGGKQVQWWEQYLDDVPKDKVEEALTESGLYVPSVITWLFEKAAECRLAFASLSLNEHNDTEKPSFPVPEKSIISQTRFGMAKGRPKTAQWAFWFGYMLKDDLSTKEKKPTSDYLAKIIGLLLNRRRVAGVEVRTKFSEIRKDAEKHATETARDYLHNNLNPEISSTAFGKRFKSDMEEVSTPENQWWPVIENGKVRDEWLDAMLKTRSSILRRIKKHGPLAGQAPLLEIKTQTKLIHQAPLTELVGSSPQPSGEIHLDKTKEVPLPRPLLQKDLSSLGEVALSISKKEDGSVTKLKFPADVLAIQEPFAAALVALPAWWNEWMRLHAAMPKL